MSSTTTTQFYGLTQYIGDDKPDFADNNTAFRNVDADLHQVVQDSQGFASDIADLTQRVGNLDTDLTNLSGDLDGEKAKITALQNKELSQDTEISRVERNAQDMITAYNEASATSTHAYAVGDYFIYNNVLYQATAAIAVGATIVPDTNCTTTNVTSELIQLNSDLTSKTDKVTQISIATGDGTKTYAQVLNELLAGHSIDSISHTNAYIDFYTSSSGNHTILRYTGGRSITASFSYINGATAYTANLIENGSQMYYTADVTNSALSEISSNEFPSGNQLILFA